MSLPITLNLVAYPDTHFDDRETLVLELFRKDINDHHLRYGLRRLGFAEKKFSEINFQLALMLAGVNPKDFPKAHHNYHHFLTEMLDLDEMDLDNRLEQLTIAEIFIEMGVDHNI